MEWGSEIEIDRFATATSTGVLSLPAATEQTQQQQQVTMPKAKKTKTFAMLTRSACLSDSCCALKARKDRVITKVLEEIDKLPIDPKTGVLFRGSLSQK